MELIFTGTGSGKTSLKRYHTSTIISSGDFSLLVDAGEGISRALLNSEVAYNSINAVLFSHFHPDHLNGISSLLIQMKMSNRLEPLKLLVHQNLYSRFIKFLETGYIFKERMGFDLKILTFGTESFFRVSEDIAFISKENSHLGKYSVHTGEMSSLVSSSFLLYAGSRRVFYSGDLGRPDDLYLFENEKIEVYITETTHVETSDLEEAILKIKPDRVFLNHINDADEQNLVLWSNSLPESLRGKVMITYDGLRVDLNSGKAGNI